MPVVTINFNFTNSCRCFQSCDCSSCCFPWPRNRELVITDCGKVSKATGCDECRRTMRERSYERIEEIILSKAPDSLGAYAIILASGLRDRKERHEKLDKSFLKRIQDLFNARVWENERS